MNHWVLVTAAHGLLTVCSRFCFRPFLVIMLSGLQAKPWDCQLNLNMLLILKTAMLEHARCRCVPFEA